MKTRKQIHLKNFSYRGIGYVYFITICTADKIPYFKNYDIAEIVVDEIEFRIKAEEITLISYCIMPDHVHLLLSFTEKYHHSLQNWISSFKRYTNRIAKDKYKIYKLWQTNFHEHIVRKQESLIQIAEYILNNHVRKGLVEDWTEYKYNKLVV